jgi:site-specific recombinase XerC
MARVYKKKRNGTKERHWTIIWWDAAEGRERRTPGFSDKEASLSKGRALERAAERRSQGLDVPEASGLGRRIVEVCGEYLADLARRGATELHRRNVALAVPRAAKACGWEYLRDVRPRDFGEYLGRLATAGRSPNTRNQYLTLWRTFADWCVGVKLLAENPLSVLAKASDPRDERPCRRRAFTRDELARLCAAAPDRAFVYGLAAWTGFRRRTLGLLERRHLDLTDPVRPVWRLDARALKGRRPAVLPVVPEALDLLRQRHDLASLHPKTPLCGPTPAEARFLRDLARADVPRLDAHGRRLVFHSLRYTFCARMADRLPVQKVKVLMCHRTLAMTADLYGDLGLSADGQDAWTVPAA